MKIHLHFRNVLSQNILQGEQDLPERFSSSSVPELINMPQRTSTANNSRSPLLVGYLTWWTTQQQAFPPREKATLCVQRAFYRESDNVSWKEPSRSPFSTDVEKRLREMT